MTTASPEIRNVDCAYPEDVSTTTTLKLERPVAIFGVSTTATASVSTDAGADAPGRGRVILKNSDGSVRNTWTERLRRQRHGHATARTRRSAPRRPRKLPPEALLDLQAQPLGRGVLHRPQTGHAHGGERARERSPWRAHAGPAFAVRSASPLDPHGRVRIVVKRNGNAIASQVHRLRSGRANATFRKFRPGHYDVKVRYFGARNFRGSSGEDGFRVYRH